MRGPWGGGGKWRRGGIRRKGVALGLLGAVAAIGLLGAGGLVLSGNPAARELGFSQRRPWQQSPTSGVIRPNEIRVTDGDTFRIAGGERVRILNIDAPEMGSRARCASEALLAGEARRYLMRRIRHAQRIDLAREGQDRFGRTLARVRIDGQDIGDELVRNRLAQVWRGHRAAWCVAASEWEGP